MSGLDGLKLAHWPWSAAQPGTVLAGPCSLPARKDSDACHMLTRSPGHRGQRAAGLQGPNTADGARCRRSSQPTCGRDRSAPSTRPHGIARAALRTGAPAHTATPAMRRHCPAMFMKAGLLIGISQSLGRAATVVPITLLTLFAGVLWLAGLFCGKERRSYVVKLNSQVMAAISSILSSPGDQEITEKPDSHPARDGQRQPNRRGQRRIT